MNINLAYFIIGFSIIIVLAGTFYIGGAVTCKNSEGELINWGYNIKCNKIDIVKACEYGGKLYTYDTNITPPIDIIF